jgi:SAM-dependent methyltransferase
MGETVDGVQGSVSFDRLADIYDATRGGLVRGRQIADEIAPWIGDGPVLEIGVGTGSIATALTERHGVRVVGVDLSPRMLTTAHQRLGDVVACGDALRLPIGTGRVGTVVCVWVLHLVASLDAALAEAARALHPDRGRLVVVVAGGEPDECDEIDHLVSGLVDRFRRRDRTADHIAAAAQRAGLRLTASDMTAPQEWEQTPNAEADRIERRTYSALLDVDDVTFERTARPVIDALRALPHPNRPRRRHLAQRFLVLDT